MRVVSLVPAATEIACALGAGCELVAVTHDCDYPPMVRVLPRVTSSTIPRHSSSAEIDALVRSAVDHGESTFHLDEAGLRDAQPDLILGQTLCRVCAVTLEELPATLSPAPRVVPLQAESLEGVFADIGRVGQALGRVQAASELQRSLRERLATLAMRAKGQPRPHVACLEWLEPIFAAGHWVPEQVAAAGGIEVLGEPAAPSREVAWDAVVRAAPEVLVLMPCGFNEQRALEEAAILMDRPGWSNIPAVRLGSVFAVDGSSYFSRPGPRLVDGAELLAGLFHPEAIAANPRIKVLRVAALA
jgi:iron complex transport system substrate-binding protein